MTGGKVFVRSNSIVNLVLTLYFFGDKTMIVSVGLKIGDN